MATTIEQIEQKLRGLPPEKLDEVADFVEFLWDRHAQLARPESGSLLRFAGLLEHSSLFEGDPVDEQRRLRDEWR